MSKKAKTEDTSKKDDTPVHPVEISFKASYVKTEKDKEDNDVITVSLTDPTNFFTAIMLDELLKEFITDIGTKRFISKQIGVKGLLATYEKKEVLNEITWEYVKEYFFDHMDEVEILNYIGFEKVKNHFKDKILTGTTSQNDINSGSNTAGPNILEALKNESEGQSK